MVSHRRDRSQGLKYPSVYKEAIISQQFSISDDHYDGLSCRNSKIWKSELLFDCLFRTNVLVLWPLPNLVLILLSSDLKIAASKFYIKFETEDGRKKPLKFVVGHYLIIVEKDKFNRQNVYQNLFHFVIIFECFDEDDINDWYKKVLPSKWTYKCRHLLVHQETSWTISRPWKSSASNHDQQLKQKVLAHFDKKVN